MCGVFLLLAVIFLVVGSGHKDGIQENPGVDTRFIAHPFVRDPLVDGPKIKQAGFAFKCHECHQNITPSLEPKTLLAAHQNVILEHGINNNCYNCHHRTNREALLDINAREISFSQSELLCRKCHGPTYRDWEIGIHGRPSGFWDKSRGNSFKALCVACHDPHSPKFKPIQPAPGPTENHSTDTRSE